MTFQCPHCKKSYKADFHFPITCSCGTRSDGNGNCSRSRLDSTGTVLECFKTDSTGALESVACCGHGGIGPGTELRLIFDSLKIHRKKRKCSCKKIMLKMNRLGVTGCKEKRDELLVELKLGLKNYSASDWVKAAAMSIPTGLIFKLNPANPIPGLFDEAVRRAGVVLDLSRSRSY